MGNSPSYQLLSISVSADTDIHGMARLLRALNAFLVPNKERLAEVVLFQLNQSTSPSRRSSFGTENEGKLKCSACRLE